MKMVNFRHSQNNEIKNVETVVVSHSIRSCIDVRGDACASMTLGNIRLPSHPKIYVLMYT